jgi:hypothetical protein
MKTLQTELPYKVGWAQGAFSPSALAKPLPEVEAYERQCWNELMDYLTHEALEPA